MKKTSETPEVQKSKELLWHGIQRHMLARDGSVSLYRLSKDAGIGMGTAARLRDLTVSTGLDTVEAIAAGLNTTIWQLLDPTHDPVTSIKSLSPQALELARAFDRLNDPQQRALAYNMCSQIVDFSQTKADPELPKP